MLLAVTDAAAPGERIEKRLVDAPVERRQLQPRLQMRKDLVAGQAANEMLQDRRVAAAEATPLRQEPALEHRAAGNLQPVDEVAGEQPGQRSQPLHGKRPEPFLGRARHLDGIDEAVREVEPDGVGTRIHPATAGLIDDAPELAEAPAELAARIVGHVPQQLAKPAAGHRLWCHRQIGEQRARLARCRQGQRDPVATDRERPEQAHPQGGGVTDATWLIQFHWRFHAGSHARLHGWPVRSRSRSWSGRPRTCVSARAERQHSRINRPDGERSWIAPLRRRARREAWSISRR